MGMPKQIFEMIVAQAYQQRTILLLDDVDEESQTRITQAVLGLNLAGQEPITLLIDSMGGGGRFADWIVDAIRCSGAPVNGLVVGSAYSAAFWVLQNCHRRLAYPQARMMTHGFKFESLRTDQANFHQLIRESKQRHSNILEIVSRRSGQPIGRCRRWSREERNFLAPEALALGLIDEIVQPKPLPGMEAKE
jgi:ATP-dependent Clp protease, protease subunit